MVLEITPRELSDRLKRGEGVLVLDVREPAEIALAQFEGSVAIPMASIPGALQQIEGLADESDIAVLCHHGVRSLNVALWLQQHGIENCFSVTGGIDQWSLEIDPTLPRY